jgi:phosphohistidine swiveling domain-containing protein
VTAPPQTAPATTTPRVVGLDEPAAAEPALTGTKAAALARAGAADLPIVAGFVLTTAGTERLDAGGLDDEVVEQWRRLSQDGELALVVRSSSTVEDLGDSSMAGRFASVVGVRGRQEFDDGVRAVVASREAAAAGSDVLTGREPIAVLVQPLLDARVGGVLFGIDPVSGREDRLVVAAVEGGPDRLVSGTVDGSRYVLDRDGRGVDVSHGDGGTTLRAEQLTELARLAARTAQVFGGPQDVEWAYDGDGRLRLLQSRPVTATPRGVSAGPVLGPGPVAETFPLPLRRLEQALWLPPLREALVAALRLAGAVPPAALGRSPVVVVVGGRVAVDLDLLEPPDRSPTVRERLDPRPRLRRLRGSWRVGRLRAALPSLARDVVAQVDDDLAAVPELHCLSDRQLVALLHRAQRALTSVHAHEVLVGLLVDPASSGLTGVSAALRVLAQARSDGLDDETALATNPVLLALVPPRVGARATLPADVVLPALPPPGEGDEDAAVREALRLRARWLQELTARAAEQLALRLTVAGRLAHPGDVADLDLEDLTRAVREPGAPLVPAPVEVGEALPARFQLSDRGLPVALLGRGSGTGAGGGRGVGPVHHGDDPPEGAVLVVRSLDPALAPVLPRLAGLVAETGSVLAHLAILARESGVPTVVGLAGALDDLPPGTVVEVDGDEGRVERREEER